MRKRNANAVTQEELDNAKAFLESYLACKELLALEEEGKFLEKSQEKATKLACVRARERMKDVEEILMLCKTKREKVLLYFHYLEGNTLESIADTLDFSRRTATRCHQRALSMVARILRHRGYLREQ